ncbi:MAG: spore coat protein CotJB [Clostridia bacterium]|nr:spore coat protein CotJB [Clostridia bacterium]MBR4956080.1 spore coat protein CotJB [Clostridia bacterium]
MNERETKLLAVQQADFVLYDALLFLDTHPECAQALEYYKNARLTYQQAASEYESLYGPLSRRSAGGHASFNWLSQPMPWEKEA